MSTKFEENLSTFVNILKENGYTYKDGKIYNPSGSLASYPIDDAKTDVIRLLMPSTGSDISVLEAPLELVILAWHNKPVREDAYPVNIDGDMSNTHVENLVYPADGEKTQELKFATRTEAELKSALSMMGIHPDPPEQTFDPARALTDIVLLKQHPSAYPSGAIPPLYGPFVKSRMNGDLNAKEGMVNYAMGLAGEAGEVVDLIKKHRFHKHNLDISELVEELGDVLFYLQALCEVFGVSLVEVMKHNARKLSIRYPKEFTQEDSIKRVDVKE